MILNCKNDRQTHWQNVLIFGYCWECGMGIEKHDTKVARENTPHLSKEEVEGYGEPNEEDCVTEDITELKREYIRNLEG